MTSSTQTPHGPSFDAELARLHELEERRSRQLQTISEVGRRLGAIRSERELLPQTVHYVQEHLGYESAAVLLADECSGQLEVMAASGFGLDALTGYRMPARSIVAWTFDHDERLLANDVTQEPMYHQGPAPEVASELAVPIRASGRSIGVLDVQSSRLNAFDETDVMTLETVAGQIGVAIENARLFDETQEALRRTKAFQELTAAVGGSLDLRGTMERALEAAMAVFSADRAAIYLVEPATNDIDCLASRNLSDEYLAAVRSHYHAQPAPASGIKNESVFIEDASLTPTSKGLAPAIRREGFRSMLLLPLARGEQVVGSLVLYHNCIRKYQREEIDLAQTFANQAAIALDHARLFEDTQRALQRKRALQRVIAAINASLDLPATLERALDAAMDVFKADRAAILLIQDPPKRVICPASRNLTQEYLDVVEEYWNRDPHRDFNPEERGIYVEDATLVPLVPELSDAARRQGFKSQLFLPLRFGGTLRGMFVLYHDAVRRYDDEERSIAQIFADQAAIAIEHARLFEAERHAREQTAVILEATRSVSSSLQLDEVLLKAGNCIAAALGQDGCGVWLLDESGTALLPRCNSLAGREDSRFRNLPPVNLKTIPRLRSILERNHPAIIEDREDLEEVEASAQQTIRMSGPLLVVPLMAYERAVGWVGVPTSHPDHRFDAAAIELAAAIGRSAALAVENARLHEQSKRLAVSEERNRLARELHDSVTQSLFSITLITQALPRILKSDYTQARDRVDRLNELARGALAEMRALIFQLRPAAMEDERLADALRKYAEDFQVREAINVEVEVDDDPHFPAPVEDGIFRVAQEALNNVAKHANADHVTVRLETDRKGVTLLVADDGVGFELAAAEGQSARLGITSMRERAALLGGSLAVESSAGAGTKIVLRVPLRVPLRE